jgi:hypothetical protein
LVVVVDLKHYRGPIWEKQHPTHVPIFQVHKRCGPNCCTWTQIPLHIAWAKTGHSGQGHSAVPTPVNKTPNAIQKNSIHLGEKKNEAMNPGLSYMVIYRATTIGCLGHMATIPNKCMNSAIYFLSGTFPNGIKCLPHAYSNKE